VGGWSCVVNIYEDESKGDLKKSVELYGYKDATTNNEMELAGVYAAMCIVQPNPDVKVRIITDSQYALNSITVWADGWRKKGWRTASHKPVKNLDFIKKCVNYYENMSHVMDVTIDWVKGHAGNEYNELADKLAVAAKQNMINRMPRNFDLY
jgi:ribonuclease HI